MAVISLIGCLLAVVFMNWAVYKGFNIALSAIVGSLIIMITGGLNIQTAWSTGMDTMGTMLTMMAPLFIFGTILGFFYAESGAAASLAHFLMSPFRNAKKQSVRIIGCLFMFFVLRVLLGLSGIDNMALIVTMVALVSSMFSELDIPRKYANAVLVVAGSIATFIPAVPTMLNVQLEMFIEGFHAQDAMIPRFLFLLLFIIGATAILYISIKKDMDKGIHFEAGPLSVTGEDNKKRPHWIMTIIPILAVFITYNYCGFESWSSLALGCVIGVVLFAPYIPAAEGKSRIATWMDLANRGTIAVPLVFCLALMPGFILTTTPGYELLVSWVSSWTIPAALGLMLVSVILVPIGASGLVINAGLATSIFIPMGLSPAAAGVIIIMANTVLDTLPNNQGMVIQAEMTGTTMQECYPSIFKTTVLWTFVLTILATVFCVIGLI